MLRELSVRDFALIERLRLDLRPGFNVFTGETGAGKSILIDAIALVLGGRASPEMIRTGAERAAVDALFDISHLPAVGAELEALGVEAAGEGALLLSREIGAAGRSLCRINGRPATVSMLRRLAAHLVEIQGQHEFHRLYRPEEHLLLLDAAGGARAAAVRSAFEERARAFRDLLRRRDRLVADEKERLRRLDLLRFQVAEIGAAAPRPGEEAELARQRQFLAHAERLLEGVSQVYGELGEGERGGPALASALARLAAELGRLADLDPRLGAPAAQLSEAALQAEEVSRQLRLYRDGLAYDPHDLARVEERLDLLRRLLKKYGNTLEEVLAFRDEAAAELVRLEGAGEEAAAIEAELERRRGELAGLAAELGALRREAAERLEAAVAAELSALGMPAARLEVRLTRSADPDGLPVEGRTVAWDDSGADRVEFLFSANPGEPVQPLARVASGGEAARLMLALRGALAGGDRVGTLVFDEIDAGLGGRAAQAVAERLAALAASHQILCVTHLATVAARADHHVQVFKREAAGRTVADARVLQAEERPREIARMLSGDGGETSLAHARELLRSE